MVYPGNTFHERVDDEFCQIMVQTMPHVLVLNGVHVYQPARLSEKPRLNDDIEEWCHTQLKSRWRYDFIMTAERPFQMFFEDENERLLFKLRWFNG